MDEARASALAKEIVKNTRYVVHLDRKTRARHGQVLLNVVDPGPTRQDDTRPQVRPFSVADEAAWRARREAGS